MKNLTISEIASLANVSKTTVSRVLNNKPDVSSETKDRILSIIKQYKFKPNALATAISKKHSKIIGLIALQGTEYVFINPYYLKVLHGITTEINKLGYQLLVCYAKENEYIDLFNNYMIEGFILLSAGVNHMYLLDKFHKYNIPFVSTTELPDIYKSNSVDINNYYGAKVAVEYLLSLGHKRIAFISSFSSLVANKERLRGYKDAMKEYGVPIDDSLIREGTPTFDTGYETMKSFETLPTAVFACSDMIAIGAIDAITSEGKKVPEDVSVVGFDDIDLASNFGLTTVQQPIFDKGKYSVRKLISLIEHKKIKIPELPVKVIVRDTTSKLKESTK